MKAAVYYGPEDIRCTTIDDPKITEPHQVLAKVIGTSICGSDLHLFRGALDPFMERGKSQTGHELIGEVVDTGKTVESFKKGDRVSMAYSCSCGKCYMCRVGQTAHCETTQKAVYGFGVPFGNLNGTHAEAMVLPHADAHALKVPDGVSDQAAVTLSCNLPTALIANKLVDIQPGETVALVGCGPTGIMALDIAVSKGPGEVAAVDPVDYRRSAAESRGAQTFDYGAEDWKESAIAVTGGRGFDKVIEMVGYPESLQAALDIVRPGGTVAALGVFCDDKFNLNLADVFLRDISLHMNGFANVQPFMWEAMRMLEHGTVKPDELFTHNFALDDIDKAFSTFHAKKDKINKVYVQP